MKRRAVARKPDARKQRRRIVVTAVIVGAIATGFYIAAFVRHW
jgi:hypothetical protein